jgi:hypothetical protein
MLGIKEMAEEETIQERMAQEELVRERVDGKGNTWKKVYFGGGAHFRNWLDQFQELWGEDDVEVEEVDSRGFQCYEESGEKMYRIWVRASNLVGESTQALPKEGQERGKE